jgi:phage shock protein PspC (stress-responsive transcriptional regulator)
VYFSLVTQTTLGYGDITPAGYLARTLAVLHACAGLFYMGAIVAYLVAAYSRPAEPPGGP